jgi:glyoxylase-like metal-dependent hydrolase (beta-lactamase superfamily II)
MTQLQYKVFVSDMAPLPESAGLQPPVGPPAAWSPLSSTLIYGPTEAVLTDPPITAAQAERLATWVASFGRRLSAIYVTHGHGDHWYGAATLLDLFPDARVYATKGVIAQMHKASPDGAPAPLFGSLFPNQIPDTTVVARPVPDGGLTVDGVALHAVEARLIRAFGRVPMRDGGRTSRGVPRSARSGTARGRCGCRRGTYRAAGAS